MLKFNVRRPDGTSVDLWHTGNFNPDNYLPIVGGTITGSLAVSTNLTVNGVTTLNGQVSFKENATFSKKITSTNLEVTSGTILKGSLEVQASSTFKNTILAEKTATFNEDVSFKKSITIDGITKFGNGIEITTGVSRFKEKVLISTIPSFKDGAPTITLALGDSDTGFNSPSDGKTEYRKNGVKLYDMDKVFYGDTGGLFKPGDYLPLAGGTVTGDIIYSRDNTLSWVRNTDWFRIGFKNTGDADTDSYGYVEIGDNLDEYFKIRKNNAGSITDIANFRMNSIDLLKNTTIHGTLYTTSTINTHDVFLRSDERSKYNICKIDDAIGKLRTLSGYTYSYKQDDRKSAGLIAQEVERILPELVNTTDDGMLNLQYNGIIALLVEAVKDLSSQLEVMKNG